MKTIKKYQLTGDSSQTLFLPKYHRILSAKILEPEGDQVSGLFLFVLVDPDSSSEITTVKIEVVDDETPIGESQELLNHWKHIDTIVVEEDPVHRSITHVFVNETDFELI